MAPRPRSAPTQFDGITFRSGTDARCAVFFNAVGVKYEYEKFTFHFPYLLNPGVAGKARYTPDFYLPDFNQWVEIKGVEPNKTDALKCQRLARETKEPAFVYVGFPRVKATQPSCLIEFGPEGSLEDWVWSDSFDEGFLGSGLLLSAWMPFLKSEKDFLDGIEKGRKAFAAPPPKVQQKWLGV